MTGLERESRAFSRYLIGDVADDAILANYVTAVESGIAGSCPEASAFDRLLTRIARIRPTTTRAVDVYARHFCPAAPFRKRLILMLAILESHARPYAAMDTVDGGGRALVFLRIGATILVSLTLFVLTTVLLTPLRIVMPGRRAGQG